MSRKQIHHGSQEGLAPFSSPFNFVFFSSASVAEPGGFPSSRGLTPVSSVRGKALSLQTSSRPQKCQLFFCPISFPLESGIRKNPFCGFTLCLPWHCSFFKSGLNYCPTWEKLWLCLHPLCPPSNTSCFVHRPVCSQCCKKVSFTRWNSQCICLPPCPSRSSLSLLFGMTDAAALQAIFHSTHLLVGTFCLAKGGKLYEVRKTLHWSP